MRSVSRRRLGLLAGATALVIAGVAMAGRGAQFGVWQTIGRASGTRDDLGPIDFATLERRSSPNDSLICVQNMCPRSRIDAEPAVFALTAAALAAKLRAIVLAEPRTDELAAPGAGHSRFVQRSFLMRYPDVIDVLVVARDDGHATLALYSRSAVGHSDLGVNRARLDRWLAALAR